MSSCTRLVLTNTHDPYAVYRRSIGAQEPALRRRTGLWGAVGNLSEDGDLWLHRSGMQPNRTQHGARSRSPPRRDYYPGAFARCRAVADPHWSPPQELRAATLIGLVGMRATALRAHLLNSALSVRRSGACDKFNLLISACMGVGHAGVAIKRSSTRQCTVAWGRSIDDGQIFAKKRRHE